MDQATISPGAAQLRKLRNAAEFRGVAAALFTGARNGAVTGFGLFTSGNEIDIFQRACQNPSQDGRAAGDSPFNNWLTSQQAPLMTVHARYVGVYLGQRLADGGAGGGDIAQVKAIIAEHGLLRLESQSLGVICKQPLITVPPGAGFGVQQTDAAVYAEQFGPMYPVGLFRLPKNTILAENNDIVRAKLQLTPAAVTLLTGNAGAFAGNFPAEGAIIAVIIYGTAEYRVGARAA